MDALTPLPPSSSPTAAFAIQQTTVRSLRRRRAYMRFDCDDHDPWGTPSSAVTIRSG
ncbi:MAG: hypothetical protein R2856_25265 [Caldilineaceae bacterium]